MALSKNDLARELFGKSRIEEASTHARETHVITGTATEDSADGTVRVDFGGNAVTADGQQSVPVTTTGDIREGDIVIAAVVGTKGTAKSPTVIGTPGGGDRTRSEIAAATKSATEAETKVDEAIKKLGDLENVIDSKADASITLDDGTEVSIGTAIKQNAAEISTKADATVTLDDGTTVDMSTTVKQDHKSLTTVITEQSKTADKVDDLSTIIREDSTGVTVGKSTDGGTTYTTARAHVSSDGDFETILPDGTVIASMGADGQQIGADNQTHLNIHSQELSITTAKGTKTVDVKDTADHTHAGGGTKVSEKFVGDGSTKSFYVSVPVNSANDDYLLTVDGTVYTPVTDITLASDTSYALTDDTVNGVTFSLITCKKAPSAGALLEFSYYTRQDGLGAINIGAENQVQTIGTAIGASCQATGILSNAIGSGVIASGAMSSAYGQSTVASGNTSHSEGRNTSASGLSAHAEGMMTKARGLSAHAEGWSTTASGLASNASGFDTIASGFAARATGVGTKAYGVYSDAGGYETIAQGEAQTVIGRFNAPNSTDLFQVGYGGTEAERKNAFRVTQDGVSIAAHMKLGTTMYANDGSFDVIQFPDASEYEALLITAKTDDNVYVSQLVDTGIGDTIPVEFSSNHWNNGVLYSKSANFTIYFGAPNTCVWTNGGVIASSGASASGRYFSIVRVVGIGNTWY